jgi:ectoine hydroxylase-related dioxygenase (phytanoyl-CoA dioxygenase family)
VNTYRPAPTGFTAAQWEAFDRDGFLVVEDVFTEAEMAAWTDATLRLRRERTPAQGFFTLQNFVEADASFAALIDHPAYVGFAYDLFGEMLKLQLSELFVRAPGDGARPERWHIDGPRTTPYAAFTGDAPMQVKFGVWLTDVADRDMGNLAFVRGSHRRAWFDAYDTDESPPDEEVLLVRRGSLTLMNTALWHRTTPNRSQQTRLNLYLGYSPSWLPTTDRATSDPDWLASLNREQRIIMRSYATPYAHAKPPAEDYPLFLDRQTGCDREPDRYRDHVRLLHRKRTTALERWRGR